jgi:hypothetical protein
VAPSGALITPADRKQASTGNASGRGSDRGRPPHGTCSTKNAYGLSAVTSRLALGEALAEVLLAEQVQDRFHGEPELDRQRRLVEPCGEMLGASGSW